MREGWPRQEGGRRSSSAGLAPRGVFVLAVGPRASERSGARRVALRPAPAVPRCARRRHRRPPREAGRAREGVQRGREAVRDRSGIPAGRGPRSWSGEPDARPSTSLGRGARRCDRGGLRVTRLVPPTRSSASGSIAALVGLVRQGLLAGSARLESQRPNLSSRRVSESLREVLQEPASELDLRAELHDAIRRQSEVRRGTDRVVGED